ncbi:DUF5131 family protein [Ruminiclostridium papyrosolvens]|uniref:Phage protein Gp37/Gp68 n=1 Tax=Ruminiclostridium papyrosolvens C7 TaxID=1330534 RepID=U4R2B2_9FIRM|nr:DUF5131 family protein [Ruminiclostridium papyrosolvens]EPR12479.1 hypothetical protein L323_07955 [Ruminiclostridium papyrosolvens C7]
MNKSKIEWCDSTWNPVTGCLHGCTYCYARKIANRFYNPNFDDFHRLADGSQKVIHEPIKDWNTGKYIPYPYCFEPTFHRYRLEEPSQKKKPKNIFVVSMGDLFGEWVPDEWIDEVFQSCFNADRHRYMFLTKNPKRYDLIIDYTAGEERGIEEIEIWNNMWFGTTINSQNDERRVVELLGFDEGHKFLSIEPLLGEIDLTDIPGLSFPGCTTHDTLQGKLCHLDDDGSLTKANKIEWVIVGAETGPGAKPPEPEWVQSIIDQCRDAGIPIFLKNNLNWPMRIQEFPWDAKGE